MSATRVETERSQIAAGPAERFDLAAEAELASQGARPFRYILVVGLTVVLAIVAYKFTEGGLLGSDSVQNGFYIGALTFTLLLAGWGYYAAIWTLGPSASTLLLDSNGATLCYSTSKSSTLAWERPRFRLRVVRTFFDNPTSLVALPREHTSLIGPYGRINYISREASDALVAQAETHGLSVLRSEKKVNPFWGKNECQLVIRITEPRQGTNRTPRP